MIAFSLSCACRRHVVVLYDHTSPSAWLRPLAFACRLRGCRCGRHGLARAVRGPSICEGTLTTGGTRDPRAQGES